MKKVFFLFSLTLSSNFAFAGCYDNMVNAFNETNDAFKSELSDYACHVGGECLFALEQASTGPGGAANAVGSLLNSACNATNDIDNIADKYDQQYEQIHDDYCACLGNPENC